jgi:pyruvate dehydrogenase (quinone)/pyruvate oxidase
MSTAKVGADLLVERLIDWGVDTIFGLPGDGINGFMEALRKHKDKIWYIHVRHEEVAAMAAVGYAKFTGKLGVCFSTAGPGVVHMMNGLLDAQTEQVPILAIGGMAYHDLEGTQYLQDVATDRIVSPLCVYSERIMGPQHIHNVVDFAIRIALGQRGPAYIGFPIDFQAAAADSGNRSKRNVKGHTSTAWQPPVRVPLRSQVEEAAKLFEGKTKFCILAGAGARGCREELEAAADRLGAPIVKAMLGKDCVPDDSPYTTGTIALVGTKPSEEALKGCELLLIVGSGMPYIEFYPKPGEATVIQIDDKPERIGLRAPVTYGLCGDAKHTLQMLLNHVPRNPDRSFLTQAQEGMKHWWALMEERGTRDDVPMRPQVPAWNLWPLLDDDAIICGDSGTVTTWAARQIKLRGKQRFSFSGTNCSMAAALPYAIGAQAAYPGRQVVAFTGDGSMTMQLGDFVTCVQHNLPVKIVVIKNNTLGLIKWEQMVFLGNPEYGVHFAAMDFVKFAEACGARGVRIDDPHRCASQLQEALAKPGPAIIECVVDEHEPPMPAAIKRDQAAHMYQALAEGTPNRKRIALTIVGDVLEETGFEAAPVSAIPQPIGSAARKIVDTIMRRDDGKD